MHHVELKNIMFMNAQKIKNQDAKISVRSILFSIFLIFDLTCMMVKKAKAPHKTFMGSSKRHTCKNAKFRHLGIIFYFFI